LVLAENEEAIAVEDDLFLTDDQKTGLNFGEKSYLTDSGRI
jgi:hypothetical protein